VRCGHSTFGIGICMAFSVSPRASND
jgi:hypothetical protein